MQVLMITFSRKLFKCTLRFSCSFQVTCFPHVVWDIIFYLRLLALAFMSSSNKTKMGLPLSPNFCCSHAPVRWHVERLEIRNDLMADRWLQ